MMNEEKSIFVNLTMHSSICRTCGYDIIEVSKHTHIDSLSFCVCNKCAIKILKERGLYRILPDNNLDQFNPFRKNLDFLLGKNLVTL